MATARQSVPTPVAPMPPDHPIRVLIAKPGLDGHDRGARVVARALRDAGMEVVYTGLRQSPEQIVARALELEMDVLGLSILSGAHAAIVPRIRRLLVDAGAHDILLVLGGTIPAHDATLMRDAGVAAIFGPGTPLTQIVTFVRQHTPLRQPASALAR